MVFRLIPVRPNDRERYQKRVEKLCKLLKDEEGSAYRVSVFTLLTIDGVAFSGKGLKKFHEHPQAKWFLRMHRLDIRAREIIDELDNIYVDDPNETDNLRGAVGEVFSYFICRKIYPWADIEVQVEIGSWKSEPIDTAGCNNEKGHCLQSKSSLKDWRSILKQKRELDKIEKLTHGKAEGVFITYVDRGVFYTRLRNAGLNPGEYKVFDRADLYVLEERLAS